MGGAAMVMEEAGPPWGADGAAEFERGKAAGLEAAARLCEARASFRAYGHTVEDTAMVEVAAELRAMARGGGT